MTFLVCSLENTPNSIFFLRTNPLSVHSSVQVVEEDVGPTIVSVRGSRVWGSKIIYAAQCAYNMLFLDEIVYSADGFSLKRLHQAACPIQDPHGLYILNDRELLAVSTYENAVKLFSLPDFKYLRTVLELKVPSTLYKPDYYHMNTINKYGDKFYVTCHYHDHPGDAIEFDLDGSYRFLDLRRDDGPFRNPHNYYRLSEDAWVIGDSYNNEFVLWDGHQFKKRFLGGWLRGLCVLPDGSFIVGVTPVRDSYGRTGPNMVQVATVYRLAPDTLNIMGTCEVRNDRVLWKGSIFSINAFEEP